MMNDEDRSKRPQRQHERTALHAEVQLRGNSHSTFRVAVIDASAEGCRLEFVEKPRVDDRVWVRFDGLEAVEGLVCWVDGHTAGVQYARPMHAAVFDNLMARLGQAPTAG